MTFFSPLKKVKKNFYRKWYARKLFLVSDGAGWILDEVARQLTVHLPSDLSPLFDVQSKWVKSSESLVHFIERGWAWSENRFDHAPEDNRYIGLWWHGRLDSDDPKMLAAIEQARQSQYLLDRIQVPTSIAEATMLNIGVPKEKLVLLPEGLDCKRFLPPKTGIDKLSARKKLGIPTEAFVIGSFQKDGNGWNEGLEPKLIKGPDILADAMKILAEQAQIHVLIPGPARGYLKQRFDSDNVPYSAPGFVTHNEGLNELYHALDLYVSPSRDEGGPAGVMEAMACGVPVVSTRSGIAVDIFGNNQNGVLVEINDPLGLAQACYELIHDSSLRETIAINGNLKIQAFDWATLAQDYVKKLYLPLIEGIQVD